MAEVKNPLALALQQAKSPLNGDAVLRALAGNQAQDFNSSPFSQGMNSDIRRNVNLVAEALAVPGKAATGQYNDLSIYSDGSVSPMSEALIDDAAKLAGFVSVGSIPMMRPANSLGSGGRESINTLLEQARARIASREAKASEILQSGRNNVRMRSATQGSALVGPDMSVPGKFRVTYFDPQGVPNGHVELPTYEEAIKRAILDGFSEQN